MSGCDEILYFVVAIHGILVRQKFMSIVHATQCHITAQFRYSLGICRFSCDQSISLYLYPHCCDIFDESFHKSLHLILRLFGRNGDEGYSLQAFSKGKDGRVEVSLCCKVYSLGEHFLQCADGDANAGLIDESHAVVLGWRVRHCLQLHICQGVQVYKRIFES